MTRFKQESIEMAGLVRVRGAWFYVLGTTAEFVPDCPRYDPTFDPTQWDYEFRDGLMTVHLDDAYAYLHALRDRVFPVEDIPSLVAENGIDASRPVVLINFDRALFVSTFFQLPLEDHVSEEWSTHFDDLFDFAPDHIAAHWWTGR